MDLQLKRLESKFQEEKINIQHHHNIEIQKVVLKSHKSKYKINF